MTEGKIINERYILSFVFFDKEPIIGAELKHTLSEDNYQIEEKPIILKQGPLSIENMKIADRNNCDIVYNPNKGLLFVAGCEWGKVNEEFLNLKRILVDELDIDLEDSIRSYEIVSDNRVLSPNKKPIELIDNYYKNTNTNEFDNIFGEKSANMMIRIVPQGKYSKSNDWYDLIIEPISSKFYRLRLVYRNKNIEKMENISKNIADIFKKIISVVEEI